MGFSPKLWGSQAWHFIHMVALSYPHQPTEEDRKQYLHFFESLKYTLPCPTCARHYTEKFAQNPPNLNSKDELFQWTVDIHNSVNSDNGKKQITYADALAKTIRNAEQHHFKVLTLGIATSISIILIILLAAKKINK